MFDETATDRMTLQVTCAGFLPRMIELSANQPDDLTIRLTRASAISGSVTDSQALPLPGLLVFALDLGREDADLAPTFGREPQTPFATTDNLGRYRIDGLTRGKYLVIAVPPQPTAPTPIRTATKPTEEFVFGPVYYPGTHSVSEAATVSVGTGEGLDGVSFALTPTPIATITGSVIGASPGDKVELSVTPLRSVSGFGLSMATPLLVQPPSPDGRFEYANVSIGRYRIEARATNQNQHGATFAATEVEVRATRPAGVFLGLGAGGHLSGRIVFDEPGSQITPSQFAVGIRPVHRAVSGAVLGTRIGQSFAPARPVSVSADGTFSLAEIPPGSYRLYVNGPSPPATPLWPRSALADGRDLLDTVLEVRNASTIPVVVNLASPRPSVVGRLQIPRGYLSDDVLVVVLPEDRDQWLVASRRLRAVHPGDDGSFRFDNLPPGRYLIVAQTDATLSDLRVAAFLETAATRATAIVVGNGTTTVTTLIVQQEP